MGKAMRIIGLSALFLLCMVTSCHYPGPDMSDWDIPQRTRDSLTYLTEHHYTLNANFKVEADSLPLEQLPVKDVFRNVYKGERIVVAEFMTQPGDSIDSLWVKVAHNQEVQGWIRESTLLENIVPVDPVSQFIHLFSNRHAVYFIVVFLLFAVYILCRAIRKKQIRLVYFNDIDSIYPMLLCVLLAFAATLYGTMQSFIPDTWEHYYFNPTLNPFKLPPLLSMFIASIWLIIVVSLALLDDLFHQVSIANAFFYLLGLSAVCIFCYLFFIYTTSFYIGYLFLLLLVFLFVVRARRSIGLYTYRCGNCGAKLRNKGECLHCGAINK